MTMKCREMKNGGKKSTDMRNRSKTPCPKSLPFVVLRVVIHSDIKRRFGTSMERRDLQLMEGFRCKEYQNSFPSEPNRPRPSWRRFPFLGNISYSLNFPRISGLHSTPEDAFY